MSNTQPTDLSPTKMADTADQAFRRGSCCSEAMVMAVTDNLGKGQSEELAAMASGLCGGMGGYKATCGVFTGGAMAISLLSSQGRLPEGKKTRELSARFHQQLLAHAGGQICEELLEDMGSIRNINKRLCRKLTRDGAEILGRVIVETESGGS